MSNTKTPRLLAAAKEFNIGKDTLVDFLSHKGFEVTNSPNFKLEEDMYNALVKEYAQDKLDKKKVDSLSLPKNHSQVQEKTIEAPEKPKAKPIEVEEKPILAPEPIVTKTTPIEPTLPAETTPVAIDNSSVEPKEPKAAKASTKTTAKKTEPKDEVAEPQKTSESETKNEETSKNESSVAAANTVLPGTLNIKGKIDLDKIQGGRPKSKLDGKTKKTETPSVKAATKPKKETVTPPKPEPVIEAKPITPAATTPEVVEIEKIPTRTIKLEGTTVLGKIELPVHKEKPKEDKNKKRKRKRIIVDDKKPGTGNTTGTPTTGAAGSGPNRFGGGPNTGQGNNNNGPNRYGNRPPNQGGPRGPVKPVVKEDAVVDEKAVQEKIRETQARLAGTNKSKSLKAKYRKKKRDDHAARAAEDEEAATNSGTLRVTEFVTVSELASLMDTNFAEVISKCMNLGLMVSINQRLDAEVIELVASEFGFEVEFITLESEIDEAENIEDDPADLSPRQPIVTIMGHVDHGKTSLLDYLREANVAGGEAGGITQHIGAYEVTLKDGREITFLDTPGHEAFTAMRARGAKVTDIAVIIIAADDAVMPQTREAISHSQAANVPMVFAINKIDKEGANSERIREQLSQMNILVEDWGGTFQCQEISAKSGLNIDLLLEKILLEADLLELKANPNKPATGIVLEASLDKGRGFVSSLLIEDGTLHVGDMIVAGSNFGKVKALTNERGTRITSAGPATPVQVLGINGAPTAGEKIKVFLDEIEAKNVANNRLQISREQGIRTKKHITLDEIGRRLALGSFKELNIIIKADFDGSAEALADSLLKLSTDEILVNIVHKGVGQITESDVLLATASDAIIIGFQVRPSATAAKIALNENIEIRYYSIIYDAIDEIKSAMEGMLEPSVEKKVIANVEVRETYKISGVGTIAGCYVLDGKITRSAFINIIRDGIVVHHGTLASLKRFKDDAKEVQAKMECGLSIKNFNDIREGDIIEAYEEVEVQRKL